MTHHIRAYIGAYRNKALRDFSLENRLIEVCAMPLDKLKQCFRHGSMHDGLKQWLVSALNRHGIVLGTLACGVNSDNTSTIDEDPPETLHLARLLAAIRVAQLGYQVDTGYIALRDADAGLSVELQERLTAILSDVFPGVSFALTTLSPSVVASVPVGNTFHAYATEDGQYTVEAVPYGAGSAVEDVYICMGGNERVRCEQTELLWHYVKATLSGDTHTDRYSKARQFAESLAYRDRALHQMELEITKRDILARVSHT